MRALLLALMLASAVPQQQGTAAPLTAVEFHMTPRVPGQSPWSIRVKADGNGTFVSESSPAEVPLHIHPANMEQIEAGAGVVAAGKCETREKNIAQTGAKKIAYTSADATLSCTFNYSDEESLNRTAATFQAIAETVEAGARLQAKKRFDHLGLDAELDQLLASAKDGHALETGNIRGILQNIVDDEEMMAMARRKAAALLALADR